MVIVNDRDVRKSGTRECDSSPHKHVVAALYIPRPCAKPTVVNWAAKAGECENVTELYASLHRSDWQAVYRGGRCSDQWERFLATFRPILDHHAPIRRIAIRNPDAPHVSEARRDLSAIARARVLRSGYTMRSLS